MANNDKVLSMIGLCMKAGKLKSGEFAVEETVKKGQARLVIVASDASENTKKSYADMCEYYKVPLRTYGTKDELGRACGKELRAAVAVTDEGLSRNLIGKMED